MPPDEFISIEWIVSLFFFGTIGIFVSIWVLGRFLAKRGIDLRKLTDDDWGRGAGGGSAEDSDDWRKQGELLAHSHETLSRSSLFACTALMGPPSKWDECECNRMAPTRRRGCGSNEAVELVGKCCPRGDPMLWPARIGCGPPFSPSFTSGGKGFQGLSLGRELRRARQGATTLWRVPLHVAVLVPLDVSTFGATKAPLPFRAEEIGLHFIVRSARGVA